MGADTHLSIVGQVSRASEFLQIYYSKNGCGCPVCVLRFIVVVYTVLTIFKDIMNLFLSVLNILFEVYCYFYIIRFVY